MLNLEPTKEGMAKEYNWLDQKYVTLPDVMGKSLEEAKKILNGFKLEYSGEGETVTYQSPKAGYYIKEGGVVKLLLSS